MPNPWDRPPLPKHGDADQDITYAAVGRVLTNWEYIEGELSHIFALFKHRLWTAEAYDEYYDKGKTTRARLKTVELVAADFFMRAPNQEVEGNFNQLIKAAVGFADRRHEVAHGIVRAVEWFGHFLPDIKHRDDGRFSFCLVPPHYQRSWFNSAGMPEYVYTSAELNIIGQGLFTFLQTASGFRRDHMPRASAPHS